jgi:hypothetical protein
MPEVVDGIKFTPTSLKEKPCDRLTANLAIHHQHCGENPVAVQTSFSKSLSTINQPYARRVAVADNEWKRLDAGWIPQEEVGYVIIENRVGLGLAVNPTAEELAFMQNQLLFIRSTTKTPGVPDLDLTEPDWVVRPGRFFVAELGQRDVWIRASQGTLNINLTIMPK